MPKNILVTGGNKGIGYETIKKILELAPEFEKIILTARNETLGREAIERLGGGDRLDFHVLDVTSNESILQVKEYVLQKYGHLDVLFNNAGIHNKVDSDFHVQVKPTFDTNLFGPMRMTKAFLPIMSEDGYILNVSSELSRTSYLTNETLSQKLLAEDLSVEELDRIIDEVYNLGADWAQSGYVIDGRKVYSHSKAFLNAFSRTLARDLRAQGSRIRVNVVCPGWVQTDMAGKIATKPIEEGGVEPFAALTTAHDITGMFYAEGSWGPIN